MCGVEETKAIPPFKVPFSTGCNGNCRNQVSMTGLRSQRSMKRGSTPNPVCGELRLFSREAISLIEGVLSVIGILRHLSFRSAPNSRGFIDLLGSRT